jgi:hypothetical protein
MASRALAIPFGHRADKVAEVDAWLRARAGAKRARPN